VIAGVLDPRRFLRLLRADAMNVSRDPMLLLAIAMAIISAILFAVAREPADAAALAAFGIDPLSRHAAPVFLVLPAILIGWVAGFLLLEDRDDGVLLAVDVTPVGKLGFLTYRVTITALVGAAVTLVALPLIVPGAGLVAQFLVVTSVAAEAVMVAIILLAVARNKVEGIALTKLTNILAFFPLLAILPSPWRFVGGIMPTYWIGELLIGPPSTPLWLIVTALAITHAGWIALLLMLMARRVG
jgi:fluoroquinolone transport system permease protein